MMRQPAAGVFWRKETIMYVSAEDYEEVRAIWLRGVKRRRAFRLAMILILGIGLLVCAL